MILFVFQGDQAVCYSDYCDIFRCDGYIENLKALEWENSNLFKLKRLDIFPFLYKYSKDLLHELSLTLSENGEVVDLESTVAGSEDRGSALTIGPPKKMLKEIERSKKVQDSFVVVGSDDSDVLRDPFGLEPKSSKIRTSFTQWLHKRERSRSEDGDGDRKEDDHKKLSIVDGFKNVLEQVSKIFNKTDNNTRIAKDKEEEIMLVETEITRKESGGSRCKIEEMQDRQNRCLVSIYRIMYVEKLFLLPKQRWKILKLRIDIKVLQILCCHLKVFCSTLQGLLDMCLSPLLIEMEDEEYAKIHGNKTRANLSQLNVRLRYNDLIFSLTGLLHKNLCWYLTCDRIDRYSSIKEARAGFVGPNSIQFLIPVIIFLASLIALLSFLVWLCF